MTDSTRNRDRIAVGVVAAILLAGGVGTWLAGRQWQDFGRMSGHMGMGGSTFVHPAWLAVGTLLVAAAVGGLYLLVRERDSDVATEPTASTGSTTARVDTADDDTVANDSVDDTIDDDSRIDDSDVADDSDRPSQRSLLAVLPADERRVLAPVFDSPGLTQIELRDRSGFSKSKVSQVVTSLEKRGLIAREPQGRTYRIYPVDDIDSDTTVDEP